VGMGITAGASVWGMPSGHTQLATSVCVFLALAVLAEIHDEGHASTRETLLKWVTLPLLAAIPLLVAWQRTHVSCHSPAQIVVGGVVGATLAVVAWGVGKRLGYVHDL
jgi:membrane-associated phospholipid phosphatase